MEPQVIWQGELGDDLHLLRIERVGENRVWLVLSMRDAGTTLMESVFLSPSGALGEEDLAALLTHARRLAAALAAPRAAIPDPSPEDDETWDDETWDEKVRAQLELAAAHPLDTFTLKFEFSETGLGYTKRLLVVLASDEEHALVQYRRHFEPTLDDGGWEYWRRGIDVQRGLHTEWLTNFLNPDWLKRISGNLVYHRVIAFEWHFNAS